MAVVKCFSEMCWSEEGRDPYLAFSEHGHMCGIVGSEEIVRVEYEAGLLCE